MRLRWSLFRRIAQSSTPAARPSCGSFGASRRAEWPPSAPFKPDSSRTYASAAHFLRPRTTPRIHSTVHRLTHASRTFHTTARRHARFPSQGPVYRRFDGQRTRHAPLVALFVRWGQSPNFYRHIFIIAAGGGLFYVYNLETVPVTGRRRFNLVSPELEAALAEQMYDEVMQQYHGRILSGWDPRARMVQRVMDRLVPLSGLEDQKWEVNVIAAPEPNAFVIPGGKVFVFTGLLPVCGNDDRLAAVLGHEIAHNVARHSAERMSLLFPLLAVNFVISVILGLPPFLGKSIINLSLGLPSSRAQESEADYIGLMMMAQACYDPEMVPSLWKRMAQLNKANPPEFLSTHPADETRFRKIHEWLPEAQDKRAMSNCHERSGQIQEFVNRFRYPIW